MVTTRPPAKSEIGTLFMKHTFDEGIFCHTRLTELAQIPVLGRSESPGLAHRKTNTFDERGLTTAPGANYGVIKRTEFY